MPGSMRVGPSPYGEHVAGELRLVGVNGNRAYLEDDVKRYEVDIEVENRRSPACETIKQLRTFAEVPGKPVGWKAGRKAAEAPETP